MSPRHRSYLLIEQGIGSGIFNVLLNAGIAWLMFRGMATVPLWGDQSIAGDTIGTAFFLPLLTTLIASRIVYGHVRKGHVPAWPDDAARWVPRPLWLRGFVFGVVCALVVGWPFTQALAASGVDGMSLGGFVTFKALFAGVLATFVTPVVAWAALADVVARSVEATVPSA
jgi:hypothetical protein